MTDQMTRPGYDFIGYPIPTETGPLCGNCSSRTDRVRHINAQAVRTCYIAEREQREEADACYNAEMAYERHLEDRGYDEARAHDAHEARMGVIPFDVAYAQALREFDPDNAAEYALAASQI